MTHNPQVFLERVRQTLRLKHLSLRTEGAYLSTIKPFFLFHGPADPHGLGPAKRPECLPVVLTRAEVKSLLARLDGTQHLRAALLYGAALRFMDCVRLRFKDAGPKMSQITVRTTMIYTK